MSDAKAHDDARYALIKQERAAAEKEAAVAPDPERRTFLHDVNKAVYGSGAASVEERLQRNRHFRQGSHTLEEGGVATK